MTEVRKPGGGSKVASVPFVFQRKKLERLVINADDFFCCILHYPQQLENWR